MTCTRAPRSRKRRSTDGALTAAMLPPTMTNTVGRAGTETSGFTGLV
jgi:hypothetical protein